MSWRGASGRLLALAAIGVRVSAAPAGAISLVPPKPGAFLGSATGGRRRSSMNSRN